VIEDGTRVVVLSSLESGEVVEHEWLHGEEEDLWSEVSYIISLDAHPIEVSVGESGLMLESDYEAALAAEQGE